MSKGTKQIRLGKVERDVVIPLEQRLEVLKQMKEDHANTSYSRAMLAGGIRELEHALGLLKKL